ncbi:hypothetical protein DXT63_00545 [Thermoanaerobacteraceae bacterium SP2]|nr:hypothetical protein DXT63_00545 [Thermoanaerobacteraceae bacterium SP2]
MPLTFSFLYDIKKLNHLKKTVKGRVGGGIGKREPGGVKAGAEDSAEHGPGVEPLKESRRRRLRPVKSLRVSET